MDKGFYRYIPLFILDSQEYGSTDFCEMLFQGSTLVREQHKL